MGPATFLIAILGCGEADAPCQQVRMLATPYRSEAACSAATDKAIMSNSDLDFPVVVARCVAAEGARPEVLKASDVQLPGGGEAQVKVSPLTR
ncbi:MAG TPA: hypothetical protein VIA98_05755 [Allosphingosinicella sp.]